MSISSLVISHHRAPSSLISKLFAQSMGLNYVALWNYCQKKDIGCLIITTCHRTEIYLSKTGDTGLETFDVFKDILSFVSDMKMSELEPYFDIYDEKKSFKHLVLLQCGLDSKIIGEREIYKQVGNSLKLSLDNEILDQQLMDLTSRTRALAKKIISVHPTLRVSISSFAEVPTYIKNLSGKKIMILGSGMLGGAICHFLVCEKNFKPKDIYIFSRHYTNAYNIATKYGAIPVKRNSLKKYFSLAEVIICTMRGGENPVLNSIDVNKKYTIFDLAVPQNSPKNISERRNIEYFGLESGKQIIIQSNKGKALARETIEKEVSIMTELLYKNHR